jgi:hypothetical protein
MNTSTSIRLGHLPASAILPGFHVSINDRVIGEVSEVTISGENEQRLYGLTINGSQVALKPRDPVALIKPFQVMLEPGDVNRSAQTLAALSFLDTVNSSGGVYDRDGNLDIAEDDDDDSWIDLAEAAKMTYETLLSLNNPYACLIVTDVIDQ